MAWLSAEQNGVARSGPGNWWDNYVQFQRCNEKKKARIQRLTIWTDSCDDETCRGNTRRSMIQCSWIVGSSLGYVQVFLHGCRHEFAFRVLQIAAVSIFCSPGLPWMWHSMNNSHRHLPTLRPEMWCSSASRTRTSLSRTKTAEFRSFEDNQNFPIWLVAEGLRMVLHRCGNLILKWFQAEGTLGLVVNLLDPWRIRCVGAGSSSCGSVCLAR